MKRKFYSFFFVLLFCSVFSYSQKEDWNWCFYDGIGLNFNNRDTIPRVFDGSMLYLFKMPLYTNTFTSLSKSDGELLLYTGGGKANLGGNVHYDPLWNSANGVVKYDSYMNKFIWTKSKLIVPFPGKDNLFYVIKHRLTYNEEEPPIQLLYDIVDITKNKGAGEIIMKDKIITDTKDYEVHGVTVIRHKNNIDSWIVTYGYHNGTYIYVSYLMTCRGITDTVEIASALAAGENPLISVSPDESLLAKIIVTKDFIIRKYDKDLQFYNLSVELSEFDRETAKLKRSIIPVCDTCEIFDFEFSPDGKKFYTSIQRAYHQLNDYKLVKSSLYQFTIDPDKSKTIKSKKQVGPIINDLQYTGSSSPPPIDPDGSPGVYSSIRIAPNGKMYIMRQDTNFLSSIDFPNADAVDIKFRENAVDLKTYRCMGKFPVFLRNHNNVKITVTASTPVCELDSINLAVDVLGSLAKKLYNWRGPGKFLSNEQNPVVFAPRLVNTGWYYVKVIIDGAELIDSVYVTVNSLSKITLNGSSKAYVNELKTYKTNNPSHKPVNWYIEGGSIAGPDNNDSVAVRWGAAGNGKISVLIDNGVNVCSGYNELSVEITDWPSVVIKGISEHCLGDTAIYTATDETYLDNVWNVSNGKLISSTETMATVLWNNAGNGEIRLYQLNNLTEKRDTGIVTVTVNDIPIKPQITKKGLVLETTEFYGYQWYLDGEIIVGETNINITATKSGRYQVQYLDSNGCRSYLSDGIDIVVAVNEIVIGESIIISPNPASDYIEISYPTSGEGAVCVSILDILGTEVLNNSQLSIANSQLRIDISHLSPGVYFVRVGEFVSKFVKL